jgi:hypothetical protein
LRHAADDAARDRRRCRRRVTCLSSAQATRETGSRSLPADAARDAVVRVARGRRERRPRVTSSSPVRETPAQRARYRERDASLCALRSAARLRPRSRRMRRSWLSAVRSEPSRVLLGGDCGELSGGCCAAQVRRRARIEGFLNLDP